MSAPPEPQRVAALAPDDAAAVLALAARAARADGGEPLSEDARLALVAPARATEHLLVPGGEGLLGYAQLAAAGTGWTAELLVDPAARGRGVGGRLAAALEELAARGGAGPLRAWAHGDSPAAAALAARRGWRRVRELQHRSRPLGSGAPLPPVELPDDVLLRPFEVGRDEEAWLRVNARAFAGHPEQGRWTADDLALREAEPWFDPRGLLLALDGQDGHLLASHWTKVPVDDVAGGAVGEVYVVAVDPSAQGRGLGRAVVLAGLHHLDLVGARRAELYVEADNAPAVRLYERLGFAVDGVDAQYEHRTAGGAPG